VRRIGRDLAFAAGGRYVTRGKGGLSQPPFCDGTVFVLSKDGEGIRMQVLGGTAGEAVLHFATVREEVRAGPLKRGLITGSGVLLSSLPPFLPILRETGLPHTLTLHGLQGRQISLEVGP